MAFETGLIPCRLLRRAWNANLSGNTLVTASLRTSTRAYHRTAVLLRKDYTSKFVRNTANVPPAVCTPFLQQQSFLWGWLNSIFNRVDESRIKEVGPDRACAEWLLRCGASIKWDKGPNDWLKDYNSLPVGQYRSLKIVEIDATDSAVMHIGFPHFRGLTCVRKAIFHKCGYLEDEAVRQIGYLKGTLEDLQISSSGNVTDEGLLTLVQMKKLKRLKLFDFLEVRDRKQVINTLKASLPECEIIFPFARESDRDPEVKKDRV